MAIQVKLGTPVADAPRFPALYKGKTSHITYLIINKVGDGLELDVNFNRVQTHCKLNLDEMVRLPQNSSVTFVNE